MLSGFEPCIYCGCEEKPKFLKLGGRETPIEDGGKYTETKTEFSWWLKCGNCDKNFVRLNGFSDEENQQKRWNSANNRSKRLKQHLEQLNNPELALTYSIREQLIKRACCLQRGYFLNQAKYM